MRRLLTASVIATAAALPLTAPAHAAPITITGSYTVTETYSNTNGGPTLTGYNTFATGISNLASSTSGNFTFGLTPGGGYSAPKNFVQFAPDNNKCEGPGCSGGSKGTETDSITATFTFTSPSGITGTASDTGTFQAKYNYPYLSCDPGGDGAGKSDCITWATANDPIVVHFTDGAVMDIMLLNASDWNITSQIQFSLISGPTDPVPEPASITLLGLGLLATGAAARRRRA